MSRRAVGVDIGSRYVKVAEVVREGARARVLACGVQEIADSSAASQAQAVVRAMRAAGIRARKVVCAVPRADAVVKRIRIPATDRETAQRVLEFEVQQHVPFAAEEMAWSFHLDEEGAVLLAAARRASLESARAILAQAALRVSAVSLSSAAAAAMYLQDAGDAAAVLIELGAGPVVVNVFRGRTWLLSQPLPLRGEDLTVAFAADLECDVGRARNIRQADGFAALPGAAPRVQEWLDTLRAEVERCVLAAAETTSLAVERIVATGGGWLTPGMAQETLRALGCTVEVVPCGSGCATAQFGTAIGLALQELDLAPKVDLTSSAVVETRRQTRRRAGSAAVIAGLLVVLGVGTSGYWRAEWQAAALQPERAAAARREQDLRSLRARQRTLEAQLAEVQGLLRPRHQVLNALQDLSSAAPAGVWLTSVSYVPGRPVGVQGKAASATQVSALLSALGARAALVNLKQGEGEVSFAIALQVAEEG